MTRPAREGLIIDRDAVSLSMKIVAKGSILLLVSVFIAQFITFARRLVIVRSLSTADYGVFSLAMSIVLLGIVVSGLGLAIGSQRFIALYRGKGDMERAKGTLYAGAVLFAIATVVVTAALMAGSDAIASVLDMPDLTWILFVMAFLLPTTGAADLIISYFQGFEIITAKAYFGCIGRSVLTTAAVIVAALVHKTVLAMVLALVVGNAVVLATLVYYAHKRFPDLSDVKPRVEYKKLLLFSLPLAATGVTAQVMVQTDTIMLGYFSTAKEVGIYNAAVPLYHLLPLFLIAVAFIFAPVAARMIGERKQGELRELYASVTKWLFVFTLPAWFIFFFYPSQLLELLFGARYMGAAFALQILSAGEFVHTLVGPNGTTLTSYGKTTLLMIDAVLAAILNIVLNLLLIPRYGISGAAIATAISLAVSNVLVSGQLYYYYRIHPFRSNYIKSVIAGLLVLLVLYYPLKAALGLTLWFLPLYYLVFLAVSFGAVVLTGSVDTIDRVLYEAIKDRFLASLPERWRRS